MCRFADVQLSTPPTHHQPCHIFWITHTHTHSDSPYSNTQEIEPPPHISQNKHSTRPKKPDYITPETGPEGKRLIKTTPRETNPPPPHKPQSPTSKNGNNQNPRWRPRHLSRRSIQHKVRLRNNPPLGQPPTSQRPKNTGSLPKGLRQCRSRHPANSNLPSIREGLRTHKNAHPPSRHPSRRCGTVPNALSGHRRSSQGARFCSCRA